jgi:phenylalanyl-tRNA synthetase beta chain
MKFSEAWLREWVVPSLSREEICDRLTMTGLEVDGLEPVAEHFANVVVGKVLGLKKHSAADELHICEIDVGRGAPLVIVCGAKNVKQGMKAPVALIGAVLPNNMIIKETEIRGVSSMGMLCSSSELGLAEESEGLLELPKDAPLGVDLWEYLKLTDHIIEVAITPNRGDCLSVRGLVRELAAITQTPAKKMTIPEVKALIPDVFPVELKTKEACPRYVGRIIRGVKADAMTPVWMKERLRRSGIRSVSPIVDVTNYVMLELGQPMHAFDLARLEKKIVVRMAEKDEALQLLDGSEIKLSPETLIIADQTKPLAIAGVMGGSESGINLLTQDIFLESAFFHPDVVARQRQLYQLSSESSYRFERGVDPELQRLAIERATRLLVEIVGGKPGPLIEESKSWPLKTLALRRERLVSILGCATITDKEVKTILQSLGFGCKKEKALWQVQVPSWRFDVTQEVDLIEELARLYGYEKISPTRPLFPLQTHSLPESRIALPRVRRLLCDLGYHEAVTYSFVNEDLQKLLDPERQAKALVNPITSDMTVMRTNLWPGLLGTYLYNRDRQQTRGRFFEAGLCFIEQQKHLTQVPMLGGLASGTAFPEQWGHPSRELDFFDVKGELQDLLQLTHLPQTHFRFKPTTHPALHPGQTALLYRHDEVLGILGALHPAIRQKFDITEPIFLFEFNLDSLLLARPPYFSEISKFPEIRRDLALLVDRHIPAQEIRDTIINSGGEWLRHVNLFDVYLGEGVPENKKSVAFALILQHATRTLRDEEVAETVERIVGTLKQTLGIELRG